MVEELIRLKARFVFTAVGPLLRDGVVVIAGSRLVGVEQSGPQETAIDLGNVAILPGLINAHTHLEFSDLAAPIGCPGMPFAEWIRAVVAYRRTRTDADRAAAVGRGLAECQQCGTTSVGDIATASWPLDEFSATASNVQATIFLESIGLRQARVEAAIEASRFHLGLGATRGLKVGLSPHAPYTAHPDLVRRLAGLSAATGVPLAMHLAESRDELELLKTGSGPLRNLLIEFDAWDDEAIRPGSTPLDYLRLVSAVSRALIIHGNYLRDEEIAFIGRRARQMSVIYCPRTHAYFQHASYPLAKLTAAGVNVALGTDSRASNPDLNLLAEMREVADRGLAPAEQILQMGTINGARALGREAELGSIKAGKRADLAIVHLAEGGVDDPYELLFDPRSRIASLTSQAPPAAGRLDRSA